jgi:MFS family permease
VRGASFGLRQSLDTAGAFLGPLLAIALMWLTASNFQAVFWVAVVPAFLAVAVLMLGVSEPDRPADRRTVEWPLSRAEQARLGTSYWWVALIAAVFTLARFSEAFLVLRAQSVGLPTMMVPAVLVIMNLVYAAAAYPAGVWSDRGGRGSVLTAGLAVLVVADLVLAVASGVGALLLGVVLWGLHMGLTQGLLATLAADAAPAELRGTAFGVFNLLSGAALLAASMIAGAVWDAAGPEMTFLAGAGFSLAAVGGLLAIGRQRALGQQPGRGQPAHNGH